MKFKTQVILAPYTTFKIGGPADYFFEAKTKLELIGAVKKAKSQNLPYKILGHGSNVLIADSGFRGLVIKNSTSKIKLLPNNQAELESGVFLPKAIFYLINHGLTGLELFSGIPATIGGATAVRMHGVGRLWEEFIVKVNQFEDVITSVIVQLEAGNPQLALAKAKAIQAKKQHQPQISTGCIWKNIKHQSTGAIIDKQLGLKGKQIGQAQISPQHANFIVNLGGATAQDVLALINLTQKEAKAKLNLDLELEIEIWPS